MHRLEHLLIAQRTLLHRRRVRIALRRGFTLFCDAPDIARNERQIGYLRQAICIIHERIRLVRDRRPERKEDI